MISLNRGSSQEAKVQKKLCYRRTFGFLLLLLFSSDYSPGRRSRQMSTKVPFNTWWSDNSMFSFCNTCKCHTFYWLPYSSDDSHRRGKHALSAVVSLNLWTQNWFNLAKLFTAAALYCIVSKYSQRRRQHPGSSGSVRELEWKTSVEWKLTCRPDQLRSNSHSVRILSMKLRSR